MDKLTLRDLTDQILTGNEVNTLRLLLEFEMAPGDGKTIDSYEVLNNFLNSLSGKTLDHFKNIRENYVFFILRTVSLDSEGQWHKVELSRRDQRQQLLKKICDLLTSYMDNHNCTSPRGGRFTNGDLLSKVTGYLKALDTYNTYSQLPPAPHRDVLYLTCIEELYHASYIGYWKTIPSKDEEHLVHLHGTDSLYRWMVLDYAAKHSLRVIKNKSESLETLAGDILKKGLFATDPSYDRDLSGFPLSRDRVRDIFCSLGQRVCRITGDYIPVLTFTAHELRVLDTRHLFVYDFVLEALMHGVAHDCSPIEVEEFLDRAIVSLEGAAEHIMQLSTRPDLTHDVIYKVRCTLLVTGISYSTCKTVRDLVAGALTQEYVWKNMQRFISLLGDVSLFGLAFFRCLEYASPTSISFSEIIGILKEYSSELKVKHQQYRYGDELEQFNGIAVLKAFIPKPDLPTYDALSEQLPSNLMRIMFWTDVRRKWHLDSIPDKCILVQGEVSLPITEISEDVVRAYCQRMVVGTSDYDVNVVRSPFFAEKFIKHKLIPILHKIMRNELGKKSIMFHLRWLLLYAVEDAVGLHLVRYRLTLLYYELVSLLEHSSQASFVLALRYWWDLFRLLDDHMEDGGFSSSFFESISTATYTNLVGHLMTESRNFNEFVDAVLSRAMPIVKLGHSLCHTVMTFEAMDSMITIPIACHPEESHVKMTIETFNLITSHFETQCQEYVSEIRGRFNQRLHMAYVKLTSLSEDLRFLDTYPMKINVLPVNITEIEGMYLRNFRVFYKAVRMFTDCCAANLHRRCVDLLGPRLIDEKLLQKILDLSKDDVSGQEDNEGARAFIDYIREPLAQLGINPASPCNMVPVMDVDDVKNIQELVEKYAQVQEDKSPRTQFQYTGKFNVEHVHVDWEAYRGSVYKSIKQHLEYVLVNTEDILSGTHG
ncbi:tegument protein [Phascolarctid gammaherpesvirus 1]|uniref:Tegument protein n=1 Tax=Phascolarctid gammaherpesvirus 1 TaxID=2249313 RepID=A0A3S8D7T0_9GAMA|nr:tegument protein [Phascolarctid gammaherpesvirus 1]AZB49235.1 tegument protein [Phascolarctid gammaherpesvirus 1]